MATRKTLLWIGLALGLQLVILAAMPSLKTFTLLTGRTVFLKIAPVDPYSILSGYYMTLGYEISQRGLPPDGEWVRMPEGSPIYVVLAEGPDGNWHAKEAYIDGRPDVAADRVVIKGTRGRGGVSYGIETYYVPETMRQEIADNFRKNMDSARVEVKVDRFGHAAIVRLHIGDRVYEY